MVPRLTRSQALRPHRLHDTFCLAVTLIGGFAFCSLNISSISLKGFPKIEMFTLNKTATHINKTAI
jgi:hypothetical protein